MPEVVCVIDDDDAVRDSVSFLLNTSGLVAKPYESAREFIDQLKDGGSEANCIVTDVRMPEMSGIDLIRELREAGSHTPVIIMTGHGDVPMAVEAMKLGAADFLEKPFDDEVLLSAIRDALGRAAHEGDRESRRSAIHQRLQTLSDRERQVLQGLVDGQANKVIAFNLGISPRTVEIYRANVMTKMEASSLSDLVRMALLSDTQRSA